MSEKAKGGLRYGARVISFLLVAGGILGIFASVSLAIGFTHQHRPYRVIVPVVSIAVFARAMLKGIDLWQGKPVRFRWARILFALQVPAFSVARLSYEFSTGVSGRSLFGHSGRRFGADIGSSSNFLIALDPQGWMLGINIVALIVLAYLFKVSPPATGLQSAAAPANNSARRVPNHHWPSVSTSGDLALRHIK